MTRLMALSPTITPFPTFVPRVTPTLAWPTPGPSAYFLSRYMATALDPTLALSPGGVLRGRVLGVHWLMYLTAAAFGAYFAWAP